MLAPPRPCSIIAQLRAQWGLHNGDDEFCACAENGDCVMGTTQNGDDELLPNAEDVLKEKAYCGDAHPATGAKN